MGLIRRSCGYSFLFLFSLTTVYAAPQLRLVESVVGPISVAVGTSPSAVSIDAYNNGTGSLNLSLTSSDTWLSATLGASHACSVWDQTPCFPVQIAMQTQSLAKGIYTGTITVSDPNAVDAPQTITVTVQVGGGFPDNLDMWVPAGGTGTAQFKTQTLATMSPLSPTGGPAISVALSGNGSFGFNSTYFLYTVSAASGNNVAEGNYIGSIVVTSPPVEAKNVNVTLHVTSKPIGVLQLASEGNYLPVSQLTYRIAQTSAPVTKYLRVDNSGSGTLTITSATADQPWLTATPVGTLIAVTVDPKTMPMGDSTTTLTVKSNAGNGDLTLPVKVTVAAAGAPVLEYQGIREIATYEAGGDVAQGGWVAAFGDQLSLAAPDTNPAPYSSTRADVTAYVNEQPAPVYYNSYGQVNFLIPFNTAPGQALIRFVRSGQSSNTVSVNVTAVAARLLRLDQSYPQFAGKGINYAITYDITDNNSISAASLVIPNMTVRPAHRTDTLMMWGFGLGVTSPAVADGTPAPAAEPYARVPASTNPVVRFGDINAFGPYVDAVPSFVALLPGYVGVYQINVQIPAAAPTGDNVNAALILGGGTSNVVTVAIQ